MMQRGYLESEVLQRLGVSQHSLYERRQTVDNVTCKIALAAE
jgi:hypothetical protein